MQLNSVTDIMSFFYAFQICNGKKKRTVKSSRTAEAKEKAFVQLVSCDETRPFTAFNSALPVSHRHKAAERWLDRCVNTG